MNKIANKLSDQRDKATKIRELRGERWEERN